MKHVATKKTRKGSKTARKRRQSPRQDPQTIDMTPEQKRRQLKFRQMTSRNLFIPTRASTTQNDDVQHQETPKRPKSPQKAASKAQTGKYYEFLRKQASEKQKTKAKAC